MLVVALINVGYVAEAPYFKFFVYPSANFGASSLVGIIVDRFSRYLHSLVNQAMQVGKRIHTEHFNPI